MFVCCSTRRCAQNGTTILRWLLASISCHGCHQKSQDNSLYPVLLPKTQLNGDPKNNCCHGCHGFRDLIPHGPDFFLVKILPQLSNGSMLLTVWTANKKAHGTMEHPYFWRNSRNKPENIGNLRLTCLFLHQKKISRWKKDRKISGRPAPSCGGRRKSFERSGINSWLEMRTNLHFQLKKKNSKSSTK